MYYSDPYYQDLSTRVITKNQLQFCWAKLYQENTLSYKIAIQEHHNPGTVVESHVDGTGVNKSEICYTATNLRPNHLYRAFVRALDQENSTMFVLTTLQRTR